MRPRYIARLAKGSRTDSVGVAVFRERLARIPDLALHIDDNSALVAATPPVLQLEDGKGLMLGTVYDKHGRAPVERFPLDRQARIIRSRGMELIESCWGPYLAMLWDPALQRVDVVRAPMGDLPCIMFETGTALFMASDVKLLAEVAGYRPSIAWDEVVRFLSNFEVHAPETCLASISDLPGGHRLTIAPGQLSQEALWSPWPFAYDDMQIHDRDEAVALLRETSLECVAARASAYSSVLLTLSGGLDSSVVAAALSRQKTSFRGLNLVTRDPNGDERHHAGRVSELLEFPLRTAQRDVSQIDIHRSAARNLTRPTLRCFTQETFRLASELASDGGAQALFNGGGGDNVFCSLQSGAPAADRLLADGPGRDFLKTAFAISEYASASVWEVMRDAVQRAWLGKPAFRIRPEMQFLSANARDLLGERSTHPWLTAPKGIPPGKAMHVRLIAIARSYVENLDPLSELPVVAPLLSQPLVELCLRIPSWLWFERGHNRLIARDAFAPFLPPDILLRRSKGTPDSFIVEIIETHGRAIRAMLRDGELARRGLIDIAEVLHDLETPGPRRNKNFDRILYLIDVEAWARGWAGSAV